MQMSAVSSAINSNISNHMHSGNAQSFGRRGHLTDDDMREIAIRASVKQAKQRQKKVKRLFMATPIVAGLAAGILHKGGSKVLGKELNGAASKIAEGFKSGGNWAYLLGLGTLVGVGDAAIAKKSEGYNKFRQNHPLLSLMGNVAAFVGLSAALSFGGSKLVSKIKPQHMEKLANATENIASHINNIKTPKFLKSFGDKVSNFIPKAIKEFTLPESMKSVANTAKDFGKVLLSWTPHITFLSAFLTGATSQAKFYNDVNSNYIKIKQKYSANS